MFLLTDLHSTVTHNRMCRGLCDSCIWSHGNDHESTLALVTQTLVAFTVQGALANLVLALFSSFKEESALSQYYRKCRFVIIE